MIEQFADLFTPWVIEYCPGFTTVELTEGLNQFHLKVQALIWILCGHP